MRKSYVAQCIPRTREGNSIVCTLRQGKILNFAAWLTLRYIHSKYANTMFIFTDKSQIPLRYLVRSWFEAGRRHVRSWSQTGSKPNSITQSGSKLVADRSATSFELLCDQLRTSFEPDCVMEFGFEPVCDQLRAGSCYLDMSR